ncbi:hypothetical protein RHMOL_Rhmol12G0096100 [Rhododendron molle]|uniref:Uncharacterized protein n=1 Tax=Rhododendron molle TaxID=49168 RepID=A0ACC0LHC4_RHOML|nr:hypothetical protein RHMOL_Rhmol12G0096100 [Rhododendron molle]
MGYCVAWLIRWLHLYSSRSLIWIGTPTWRLLIDGGDCWRRTSEDEWVASHWRTLEDQAAAICGGLRERERERERERDLSYIEKPTRDSKFSGFNQ